MKLFSSTCIEPELRFPSSVYSADYHPMEMFAVALFGTLAIAALGAALTVLAAYLQQWMTGGRPSGHPVLGACRVIGPRQR